jgi:PhzF family phenazine biosynthesis protein
MKNRPFKQVDVFTNTAYLGNPLAVVLDGTGLASDEMQHFARWTNLSETTFVLPPSDAASAAGADYQVRIFTPGGELPFAGHPTLGSCHAWLQAGGVPRDAGQIVQECAKGLIAIRRDGSRLAFAAPPLQRSQPDPAQVAEVAAALGLEVQHILASQWLDNGPVWLGLLIDSAQRLLSLQPDHARLKSFGKKVGLAHIGQSLEASPFAASVEPDARHLEHHTTAADSISEASSLTVRAFAAPMGVNEDPVTGSLNASLAQWLIAEGRLPNRYIATQGTCLGRRGQVHIHQDAAGQVWVGGDSVTCMDGVVHL